MKSHTGKLATTLLSVVLALLSSTQICYPQTPQRFKQYSFDDGFDYMGVASMAQDGQGYIWISSMEYLTRFDGYSFKHYRHDTQDSLSLIGPVIGMLLVDNTGNLWINNAAVVGLSGSLLRYDRKQDGFVRFKPDIKSYVRCISVVPDDSILWIGTTVRGTWTPTNAPVESTGLFAFDLRTRVTTQFFNNVPTDEGTNVLEGNNNIRSIEDRGNHLLLGTQNGLWLFDKSNKKFTRPNVMDTRLHTGRVTKVIKNSKHYLLYWDDRWEILKVDSLLNVVGHLNLPADLKGKVGELEIHKDETISMISGRNGFSWDPFASRLDTIHTSDLPLFTIMVDRDDNVWLGSRVGLLKQLRQPFPYNANPIPAGLWGLHILRAEKQDLGIIFGIKNNFIATTPVESGLVRITPFDFEGRTQKWGQIVGQYAAFITWHEGSKHLWIGTWGRGIIGIPIDRNNGVLDTKGALFFEHDPNNPYTITSNNVSGLPSFRGGMYEDQNGILWTATNGEGLCRIDLNIPYGTEGSVRRFMHDPLDKNSIASNLTKCVIQTNDQSLWVGTAASVELYDDGKFKTVLEGSSLVAQLVTSSNGDLYAICVNEVYVARKSENYQKFSRILSASGIGFAAEDKLGRMWIPAFQGIHMYDPEKDHTVSFLGSTDLMSNVPTPIATTTRGHMVLATDKAIVLFDPSLVEIDSNKTLPSFTKLLVNNKPPVIAGQKVEAEQIRIAADVDVLEELVLDHKHNNFTLEFSAMEMTQPEHNRYRRMLEGYDKDWIESDYRNRTATYTNLPAGEYTFRIKASNHHGVWSDNERTLNVVILPPPWRTWWAYAGYWLLVAGGLVVARRTIVQRERLKANLKVAQVEQEKEHLQLEKAQEVDKMKSAFFANISHEFRTPLTLIKGPVEKLLEEFADNPKVKERLKLVQRNSDLLLKLINQLLDLAKLESGSLKVEKSEGNLYSFIRAAASSFESFARQKKIALEVAVPITRCIALFDKDKLETILINLVNNAIKFTPAGGKVTVSGVGDFTAKTQIPIAIGSEGTLSLSVTDTGIGIPLDQQSKIFERFHQVSEAHKEVGTGIGLSLVKELVALIGGTISVKSTPGKGSAFTVILPLEVSAIQVEPSSIHTHQPIAKGQELTADTRQPTAKGQQPTVDEDGSLTKPHILIVEDNSDLRAFIIDSLGNEFYFLEAADGKQGLDIATNEVPDLIISDVMMPEMDGITMAGKVKSDIRTSHIPLILLTAKSTEESKLSGLQSGADDYLTKPFNKNELLLKVRNGVNRQQKLREKLRAELMREGPRVEVLSADEQFLNNVKEKILERLSDEQLSVESLAEDIGMSRVQLYRKVSGLTGIAVNELIRKLRLQRAAQLLEQQWGPVSQVAYEVGFSNLSYFSKVFKDEYGVLPSEYAIKT